MRVLKHQILTPLTLVFCFAGATLSSAEPGRKILPGDVPAVAARLAALDAARR